MEVEKKNSSININLSYKMHIKWHYIKTFFVCIDIHMAFVEV